MHQSRLWTVIIGITLLGGLECLLAADRPNFLVILADDLGYADVGFNGCKDIPTPHLDRLASQGLRCTNGYVTHPFCSPTRAGLLTGRHQQRFGHENNPAWLPESTVAGLPLSQTTLPQVLKSAGYATGAVGKWHLGAHPQFHPNQRGFDHYFGILGGGHIYLPDGKGGVEYTIPLDRNRQPEPLKEHLTATLGKEASAFIRQQTTQPWLLYLAFNAPHTPLQVTEEQRQRVAGIADEIRRNYAALVIGLDDAIGQVLAALEESGQAERTFVWFMSDNGGPIAVTHSQNTPLRGAKGNVYEGGIRVPFLLRWPQRLSAGRDYHEPIHSLDVFATAAALTDAKVPATHQPEGVNLLPFLTGSKTGSPHDRLYWRAGGGEKFAVREGDWKLVAEDRNKPELYNLKEDVSEGRDRAADQPAVLARLQHAFKEWDAQNIPPIFQSPRPANAAAKAKAKTKSVP